MSKDKFPYKGSTIDRMKFKYPSSAAKSVKVNINTEETIRELEEFWGKMKSGYDTER